MPPTEPIGPSSKHASELEHSGASLEAPDVVEQDDPNRLDDAIPTAGYHTLPVVGIGGSAGCIRALQQFFAAASPNSGLAFVVVLHLSPSHESALPELMERWTTMPVESATDGLQLEANHVYVIPPGKHLSAIGGRLTLTEMEAERGRRVAVDLFFRTLADTHGPHASAVVLSGADGDGALGIKRVKERGGLTIAQDPREAEYPGMPESAIRTTMVDWVLPAADIPARLVDYVHREGRVRKPPEDGPQPAEAAPPTEDRDEQALKDVLAFLRTRTGRDFTYYKRATIVRRVARRAQVNGLDDVPSYLEFLRTHLGEAGALLQDLLISVTNFFRDRQVFQTLDGMLPQLFLDKSPGESVRVWVPACATGEEAYSIAIMLASYARRMDAPPALQVFGSDLDESAIQVAREGLYPETIVADVDETYLRQWFTKESRGYRVRRELREMVMFATHDLLKDAPFSRMDLISCRNLLIYLNRNAQERALQILHFASRPGGTLLLGSAETVDEASSLFAPVDRKHRIYKQVPGLRHGMPALASSSTFARVLAAHDATRGPVLPGPSFALGLHRSGRPNPSAWRESLPPSELHVRLLDRLAPPSLVVDANLDIIHTSPAAGQFLEMVAGEPTMNVVRMIHRMLRVELRLGLAQASETGLAVEIPNIPLQKHGTDQLATLRIVPAGDIAPGCILILIESAPTRDPPSQVSMDSRAPLSVVERLEREIDHLKSQLRENVDQYELSTEELRAGNEELHAMNEELRSATEELESSREELQSINEELATVNGELKAGLEELSHANSDLHSLMASTHIATVFLDRQLRITRYTPSAVSLFNFIGADVGRLLEHLRHRLDYPTLLEDARQVLDRLAPLEREVRTDGATYLARILPYRTIDDQIAGLVLTFVDITSNKLVEEEFQRSEQRLQLIVENARDYAIVSLDLERRIASWSSGAQQILGYSREEVFGKSADLIFTEEDRASGAPEREARRALEDGRAADQRWHVRKDGSRFWGNGAMMAMHDARARAIGFVKVFRDETHELLAKQALEKSREELEAALVAVEQARAEAVAASGAKDHFLAVLSHELRTPLTPVLMAARALSKRKDLPAEAAEALAMIERNIQLEAQFIDDLLDVTRITRGKLELMEERVNLHQAIERAVEVTASELESKQQHLELVLTAPQHHVMGELRRLQQVFWNLLKNSSKFTPPQGKLRITTSANSGRVMVEVHDTGRGFEPRDSERIFSAFEQISDSAIREVGGLGLGLAIARATVEAHGGHIRAVSPGKGQGATFYVDLPLAPKGSPE